MIGWFLGLSAVGMVLVWSAWRTWHGKDVNRGAPIPGFTVKEYRGGYEYAGAGLMGFPFGLGLLLFAPGFLIWPEGGMPTWFLVAPILLIGTGFLYMLVYSLIGVPDWLRPPVQRGQRSYRWTRRRRQRELGLSSLDRRKRHR